MGLRDEILAASDLPQEAVVVPEWGGVTVYVRTLTGAERDEYEGFMFLAKGASYRNMRAKLLSLALRDEAGNAIFSAADVEALGGKSSVPIDRLADIARDLSGLHDDAAEEAEGNSESGPSAASTSA